MDTILELDKHLLIWLNSFHADWLDPIVLQATQTVFWSPLYLLLIYVIFKNFGNEGWFVMLGIGLTILLADQITSSVLKPLFQRLRPSHDPSLQGIIHLVANSKGEVYKGGLYGFASSHAANSFGLATYLWMLFKSRNQKVILLFVWAAALSYTRIYLGVHFPLDIIAGAAIGVISSWSGFKFYLWASRRWNPSMQE